MERVVYQQHIYWSRTFVLLHTYSITVAFPSQTAHFRISVHTSPRQAPPPTQIWCQPVATNCDASIYVSTARLAIGGHPGPTVDSPQLASLQHIYAHHSSLGEGLLLEMSSNAVQINLDRRSMAPTDNTVSAPCNGKG